MQLKNYDIKIFPAQLGWLKHFPASTQLKFGSASAQTFFGWTFAASALAPRSTSHDIIDIIKETLVIIVCILNSRDFDITDIFISVTQTCLNDGINFTHEDDNIIR